MQKVFTGANVGIQRTDKNDMQKKGRPKCSELNPVGVPEIMGYADPGLAPGAIIVQPLQGWQTVSTVNILYPFCTSYLVPCTSNLVPRTSYLLRSRYPVLRPAHFIAVIHFYHIAIDGNGTGLRTVCPSDIFAPVIRDTRFVGICLAFYFI